MNTARSVEEWFGKTPDTRVPQRVRVRLYDKANGCCEECGRPLSPGDTWEPDHIKALINGGENRETNLRVICEWCHPAKTSRDVAEKSDVYEKRSKHIGATRKRPWHPGLKKKVNGSVIRIGC